jgi:hypothetical protein
LIWNEKKNNTKKKFEIIFDKNTFLFCSSIQHKIKCQNLIFQCLFFLGFSMTKRPIDDFDQEQRKLKPYQIEKQQKTLYDILGIQNMLELICSFVFKIPSLLRFSHVYIYHQNALEFNRWRFVLQQYLSKISCYIMPFIYSQEDLDKWNQNGIPIINSTLKIASDRPFSTFNSNFLRQLSFNYILDRESTESKLENCHLPNLDVFVCYSLSQNGIDIVKNSFPKLKKFGITNLIGHEIVFSGFQFLTILSLSPLPDKRCLVPQMILTIVGLPQLTIIELAGDIRKLSIKKLPRLATIKNKHLERLYVEELFTFDCEDLTNIQLGQTPLTSLENIPYAQIQKLKAIFFNSKCGSVATLEEDMLRSMTLLEELQIQDKGNVLTHRDDFLHQCPLKKIDWIDVPMSGLHFLAPHLQNLVKISFYYSYAEEKKMDLRPIHLCQQLEILSLGGSHSDIFNHLEVILELKKLEHFQLNVEKHSISREHILLLSCWQNIYPQRIFRFGMLPHFYRNK